MNIRGKSLLGRGSRKYKGVLAGIRLQRKIWVYEAVVGAQLQVGFLSQGLTASLHHLRSVNIMNIISHVNSPAHWALGLQT